MIPLPTTKPDKRTQGFPRCHQIVQKTHSLSRRGSRKGNPPIFAHGRAFGLSHELAFDPRPGTPPFGRPGDPRQTAEPVGHPIRKEDPPSQQTAGIRRNREPQTDPVRTSQAAERLSDQKIGDRPVSLEFGQKKHLTGEPFIPERSADRTPLGGKPDRRPVRGFPIESLQTRSAQRQLRHPGICADATGTPRYHPHESSPFKGPTRTSSNPPENSRTVNHLPLNRRRCGGGLPFRCPPWTVAGRIDNCPETNVSGGIFIRIHGAIAFQTGKRA